MVKNISKFKVKSSGHSSFLKKSRWGLKQLFPLTAANSNLYAIYYGKYIKKFMTDF